MCSYDNDIIYSAIYIHCTLLTGLLTCSYDYYLSSAMLTV